MEHLPPSILGTITWHVGMADGLIIEAVRPNRGDAAPVNVWTPDGRFSQDTSWRHPAGWAGCTCPRVLPEPAGLPLPTAALRLVAS